MRFRTTFLKVMPPSSLEGMEKYLGSGMIRGIGPHFAKTLVTAFGEEVFDVIEHAPERLRTLDGIGPKRVERITAVLVVVVDARDELHAGVLGGSVPVASLPAGTWSNANRSSAPIGPAIRLSLHPVPSPTTCCDPLIG